MFAEGSYNQRLEIVADFPKGKAVWWFDKSDMRRVKQVLGNMARIAGNVGLDLMTAGTPDEVDAYCKELIEVVGKDGGFILANGCGVDHAKAENKRAMIEAGKKYGFIGREVGNPCLPCLRAGRGTIGGRLVTAPPRL